MWLTSASFKLAQVDGAAQPSYGTIATFQHIRTFHDIPLQLPINITNGYRLITVDIV